MSGRQETQRSLCFSTGTKMFLKIKIISHYISLISFLFHTLSSQPHIILFQRTLPLESKWTKTTIGASTDIELPVPLSVTELCQCYRQLLWHATIYSKCKVSNSVLLQKAQTKLNTQNLSFIYKNT